MEQYIIDHFHKTIGTFKDGKSPPIFPGPQPVSIERKHFEILKNEPYVVCEKTDGVRHALVCTTFNGTPVAAFLNRALHVQPIKINIPTIHYNGTVLDGELVDGNLFMIYDAMQVHGEILMKKNLLERLEFASKFVRKVKNDSIKIKLKKFFVKDDIEELVNKHIPQLSYKTDGLVFTPVKDEVRIGTHETMFKWKPCNKNTIDFKVKKSPTVETPGCVPGPPVWRLYIQERGKLIHESQIPLDRMSDYKWIRENDIVECMYVTWENGPLWWKPLKKRSDKTFPNSRRTFYRTLVNIKENIQMKEFLDCRPGCNDYLH